MTTALIGLAALALLCLFGLPVLALIPGSMRYRLLPGLPVLGVIFLVIVHYALDWLLTVSVTSWIAVALAVILVIVGCRIQPIRWRSVRQVTPAAIAVLAIGGVGAVLSWIPSFLVRTNLLVQPSQNLDAIWYVSTASWLKNHTLLSVPQIGETPASGIDALFYGPAIEAATLFNRVGQEMVLGTFSTITGIDLIAGFSSWMGVWVLVGAGGAWIFGELFSLSTRARLAIAVLLTVSSTLIFQVLAQNASSLLGIPLIVAACGLVGSALRRERGRTAPLWLAAVSVAAALGVYSEYLPFLAVALVATTLMVSRQRVVPRLKTAVGIVGLSVLLAPVIWIRVVASTLDVGRRAAKGGSEADPYSAVISLLGPVADLPDDTSGIQWIAAVAAVLVVATAGIIGLVAGLLSPRTRGFVVGAGLGGAALGTFLILTANEYIGHRAVDMITPLLILSASVGWVELSRFAAARWAPVARAALAVVTVVALVTTVGVNVARSVDGVTRHIWTERVVSEDFSDAAAWVSEAGGEQGDAVTVAVATLWDQLWLAEALADYPDVAWVNMRGDLGYRGNPKLTTFWEGELDRYLIAGPGAYLSPNVTPVESNPRFSLVDWQQSPGVVVIPDPTFGKWDWAAAEGIVSRERPAAVRILAGSEGGSYALSIDDLGAIDEVRVKVGDETVMVPVAPDGSATVPFTIPASFSLQIKVVSLTGFRLLGVTQEAP